MWAWQLAKALYTSDLNGYARFVSMQNLYNLLYREEEREMNPLCAAEKIALIPWSPTAAVLLSGGSDGSMRWWDVQSGECLRVQKGHQGAIQSLSVSPDGRRLASCGDDDVIKLWDLESAEHLQTLRRNRPYERLNITGIRGITEEQKKTLRVLGAFEETSGGE